MKDISVPYKCDLENCPQYLQRPICQNHAHVMCELFEDEADIAENYKRKEQLLFKMYDSWESRRQKV